MRVLLKAEDYEKVLPRLAAEVIEKENMDKLSIVGIRRRGDYLAVRLKKLIEEKINIDIPIGAIDINLVLYTGRTIRAALNALFEYGRPQRVVLLVLVDRFGRELPISANYVGLALNVPADQYISVRMKELEGEDIVLLKDKA